MENGTRIAIALLKIDYLMNTLPDEKTVPLYRKMTVELLLAETWESVKDLHSEIRKTHEDSADILLFDEFDKILSVKEDLLRDMQRLINK